MATVDQAGSLDRLTPLRRARTVVVKIGTGVLTDPRGAIDRAVLESLANELVDLAESPGRRVALVSSGAIALGVEALGFTARPRRMDQLQACAAAGQGQLIRLWSEVFARRQRVAAQVLLTHSDFAERGRYLNARGALDALLVRGAIPVINENDTVSVEEIAFGDNDSLSAQVANLLGAELLVMLSVAPGLLDGERRVTVVAGDDRGVDRFVRTDVSGGGKGGMVTKLKAARAATAAGATAVIAPGRMPGVLAALMRGDDVGTVFLPGAGRVSARAHWIAHTLRGRGSLVVDAGARKAVLEGGRSLLPSGVVAVRGTFRRGDPVDLVTGDDPPFARGLSAFSSAEMNVIRGRNSREVGDLLGAPHGDEAIHRDDLVVL
jgi:glutamate 5-kinase